MPLCDSTNPQINILDYVYTVDNLSSIIHNGLASRHDYFITIQSYFKLPYELIDNIIKLHYKVNLECKE